MLNQFRKIIKKYNLISPNDKLLVGVSGGPDSVCLLFLLNSIEKEYCLKIYVSHLDHMIRKDSHRDALFVSKLAKELGLPFYSKRINVKCLAKDASLEQEARRLRYDFFFKTARRLNINKIALGHNADDQAETVLMRIIRGTGLYGLAGILPKRDIDGFTIIRPLIEISKKSIIEFLKSKKLKYVIDITNKEELYLRNRLRNKLIPELQKYNSNIKNSLCNLAQNASLDYEYIKKESYRAFKYVFAVVKSDTVKLRSIKLKNQDIAIQRMIFRIAVEKLKGDIRRFTYNHWLECKDLIDNRPIGSIVYLPASISAKKDKKNITIFKQKSLT